MKIVTHSGSWHADEVLAIALLAVVLKKVFEVTRTRDPKVIQEALQDKNTYVLDVSTTPSVKDEILLESS